MGPAAGTALHQNSPGILRLLVRKLAQHSPSSRVSAKKFAQRGASGGLSAKKLAQRAIKHPFWAIFRVLGELFRAYTMTTGLFRAPLQERAMQGEKHRAQDSETRRR